ncbi:SDR family NAD(P)-dependent oxidoreductase [Saccharothrix isguenensis]
MVLHESAACEPIAIIGMGGRFPGASDPEALWRLVVEGRDAIAEAPADRPWFRELHDTRPRVPGRVPTTRGGFLPDLDRFDAAFFDVAFREARRMDPQLRLLLEVAYETAQDAGVGMRRLAPRARTGVFVGSVYGDYWQRQLADLTGLDFYAELVADARAALSGRLAYAFDLRGPALTVDTACSSSLVAVQLACQSLRSGECEVALAGGSNIILTPYSSITFGLVGALSADGRCKFGDASADGYVRSEAVGLVLLKPLARAVADGDRVRAVVLGGAVNNDGFSGGGMAAPAVDGQVDALRTAYANAGVDPREVAFVEAHGTGTPVGDRVELTALTRVLGPRDEGRRCLVGSVKTAVGHTEAAAGVVGLIKAVWSLKHRTVPGTPRFTEPNPVLDPATSPLWLPTDPVVLPDSGEPLLAGINSFGATGTNVHLVLSSAPRPPAPQRSGESGGRPAILAISARSADALRTLAGHYADLLDPDEGHAPALDMVCAAAATRRDHWEHRLAVTASTATATATTLREFSARRQHAATSSPVEGSWQRPRVVFVFPGQGSQWHGMGRELLAGDPAFRESLRACDAVIRQHAGWSLVDALRDDDPAWLRQTAKVQPALWAMGVALASTWQAWGVTADAVLGQSQGEIAAAHWSGALSLEEAGRLSCLRAGLIDESAPPGAMCWVELPHTAIPALLVELDATASIAVVEGPGSTVLSGAVRDVERIVAGCERRGVSCQRVDVTYAAHSPQIDPVRQPLLAGLAGLAPGETAVPFLSTVTGGELPGTALDRDYWWRNLRETVRVDLAVRAWQDTGPVVFLQMAPHPVLDTALRDNLADRGDALVLGSLRRGRPELAGMHEALAALYAAGCDPDWHRVHGGQEALLDLPRYPWQRSRHWHQADGFPWPPIGRPEPLSADTATRVEEPGMIDTPQAATPPDAAPLDAASAKEAPPHPWLAEVVSGGPGVVVLRGGLHRERDRFLVGHRVAGRPVMPGAGFVELALAAARHLTDGRCELREVAFHELLLLDEVGPWDAELRATAEPDGDGWRLDIAGRAGPDGEWISHATARLSAGLPHDAPANTELPAAVSRRCRDWQAGERFYRDNTRAGNSWEGAFRGIAELWRGDGETLARLRPAPESDFLFHPATLDSCLQAVVAAVPALRDVGDRGFVLTGIERLRMYRAPSSATLWSRAELASTDDGMPTVDVTVVDDSGTVFAELTGIRARPLVAPATSVAPGTDLNGWRHTLSWREVPATPTPADPGHWVLLCAGDDVDAALADRLVASGCGVTTIGRSTGSGTDGVHHFPADPESEADLVRALSEATRRAPVRGVVSLHALAAGPDDDASVRAVQWTATDLCTTALTLARAVRDCLPTATARLFLLTRGAQSTGGEDRCQAPWQAVLWGLGQVLGREERSFPTVLVDLDEDHAGAPEEASDLAAALLSAGAENQLALRGRRRLAPRLLRGHDGGGQPEAVVLHTDDGITGLGLLREPRPAPGPGQIEVEVTHAGLNHRDVLAILGAIRGEERSPGLGLGLECAGRVSRVGTGVHSHQVGDEVLAYGYPLMRSHVVVQEYMAVRKPARLSPAQAAALPLAHMTAYHGLVELARLQPGERVLIHSGTGGVGQAALEIARWRGATAYATAGNATKRDLLLKLGAARVADSRSPRFAEELLDPAQGDRGGVDVVLNTLVGDAVEANFALLNPCGRYVDIAKNDIAAGRPLSMAVFSQSRSYHAMNLLDTHRHDPQRLGTLLRKVVDLVDTGELAAPNVRVFPVEQAEEAFTLMARSGHTGKLALSFPTPVPFPPVPSTPHSLTHDSRRPVVRPDATYLVTGGLSGIGGLFAQWLVDQGARHLLLTGRSDVTTGPRAALLTRLRSTGAEVEYAAVDVADPDSMADLLHRRESGGSPKVCGVVHSAAVLDPAPALDLSSEDLDRTLRPKVAGGWALHRLFPDRELDFFVLFSSAVSLLAGLSVGNQVGAYAAANTFVDALAAHRRAAGLPATVVNWGYWTEVGLAARLSEQSGHDVRPAGMAAIRPADGPRLFAAVLASRGRMICLPADWQAYARAYPHDTDVPLLNELLNGHDTATPPPTPPAAPPALPPSPASPTPAEPLTRPWPPPPPLATPQRTSTTAVDAATVEDWLTAQLARVLGMPPEQVDRTRPMSKLGLDSLMAADLRNHLRRHHGYELTIPRLLEATSLRALAADLAADAPRDAP